jgi:hypothetical protein
MFSALPSVTNRMMSMTVMLNVTMVLVMSMMRTASIVTFSASSQRYAGQHHHQSNGYRIFKHSNPREVQPRRSIRR